MSWRDRLTTKASFRNANFFIESSDVGGGRRKVRHEFPGRDDPLHEDLGKKTREIPIQGYVIGDDYLTARDKLMDALENPALGQLVHPLYGKITVAVIDFRVSENNRDGAFATFSMVFERSQSEVSPSNLSSKELDNSATAAVDATKEDFVSNFSTEDKQQFIADDAAEIVTDLSSGLARAKRFLKDTQAAIVQPKAELDRSVNELSRRASTLVRAADELGEEITNIFLSVKGASDFADQVYQYMREFFDFGDDLIEIPETTNSRRQQAFNREKLFEVVKISAIAEAARATIGFDFASNEDAQAIGGQIVEQINIIIYSVQNDEVFGALILLKSSLAKFLNDAEKSLASVVNIILPVVTPALVLSYELYDDAEQDEDIAARNNIDHPGFLPSDTILKVLSSVD